MHIRHILSLTVTIRGELPSPPGPDPVRRGVTRGVTMCDLSCLLDPYRFFMFFQNAFSSFSVSCWVILLGSAWCDNADDACRNSW